MDFVVCSVVPRAVDPETRWLNWIEFLTTKMVRWPICMADPIQYLHLLPGFHMLDSERQYCQDSLCMM